LQDCIRTHLKNVFWPNIFVGASLQILDIQQYASGLKLGPAARVPAKPLGEDGILNQNPIFEMGSNTIWLFQSEDKLLLIRSQFYGFVFQGEAPKSRAANSVDYSI
jgi:hypothetical protein